MDFGQVLTALKAGGRARRPAWDAPSYLELRDDARRACACLVLCGGIGTGIPWYPAHEELLAEDWVRIDDDTTVGARQRNPPEPDADAAEAAEPAPGREAGAGRELVVSVKVRSALVLGDDDVERLVARIGARIACALPQAGVKAARR